MQATTTSFVFAWCSSVKENHLKLLSSIVRLDGSQRIDRSRRDGPASLRASLIRLREGLRLCGRCARGVCGQDVESPGWDKPSGSAGARPPEEAVVRISLWAARALSGEPLDSLPY